MSIEASLEKFKKTYEEMTNSLEDLKRNAKEEGAKVIEGKIRDDQFDSATGIIRELDEFTKLVLESNAEEIIQSVEKIFNTRQSKIAPFKFEPKVDKKVEKALEIIGYSGDSRLKDVGEEISEETIRKLHKEGLLSIEQIPCGKDMLMTFELTTKGRRKFEELFGDEPNESLKSRIERKYENVEKGFFLYDIENGFKNRGYDIHEFDEQNIEISKDEIHYYLIPDLGYFDEEDYFDILDRKNELKNIGFVAINFNVLKKARIAVEKWVLENESKCDFLSIHFTSIQNIENSNRIFDTISF